MLVKVFVLGSPGSGKSTTIQRITELAARWSIPGDAVLSIKDYTILREMFEQDVEHKRFQSAECNGFDVTDFSVLDEALKKVEEKVRELEALSSQRKEIVLIEFARNDYYKALNNFTTPFLTDAHFLFIDAELEKACIERIHKRRRGNSLSEDRHSVSDAIMRSYYATHNWTSTLRRLTRDGRGLQHVTTYDNNGSLEDFKQKISEFAKTFFDEMIFEDNRFINQKPPSHDQQSSLNPSPAVTKEKPLTEAVPV